MITFEKYTNELINFLINENYSDVYILRNDEIIIGYGKINTDVNNKVEIFILPEYRGNGYGKQLFDNLIKTINNLNCIMITFENNNVIAKRIIESFGGKQESLTAGIVRYILPLNNDENL